MTLSIEGFNRFVTSTVAPIATGWSESCRAGFAPAERPCIGTAHMKPLLEKLLAIHAVGQPVGRLRN